MNRKNFKGFTLLELLTVVLIIGILVSVAVPQYRVATEKAKVMSILPIMRQIRVAQEAYSLENDGALACDLAKLNVKVDVVKEYNQAYDNDPQGERIRNKSGQVISQPADKRDNQRFNCGYSVDHPWEEGEPWFGNAWKITLKSKDVLQLGNHQVTFNSAGNHLWIDYHLLGTYGEYAGQWSYTGCKSDYHRCDAVCYARCKDSIWEKVCKSISGGNLALVTPTTTSINNCPSGGVDGTKYCIKGAAPQSKCPNGSTPHD